MNKSIVLLTSSILASVNASATPLSLLPDESRIEFTVKEMGVPVSGEFKRFEAMIDFDPARPESSSADMRIDTASLTTGNEEADTVALDSDWLDKAHAPYATFKSASIRALGGGRYEAAGTLNIRNKARNIVVQFNSIDQATGKTILVGEFIINRSEFGVGGGVWNEGGVIAEEVPVKVRLSLAPKPTGRPVPLAKRPSTASGIR